MVKKVCKLLALWFVMGSFYFVLEGIWRIPEGGYANIVMLPVGGLCGIAVGGINQIPGFYRMKVFYQSVIGAVITLLVEFVSGLILNVWLGLGIWDYSDQLGNIMGQICPQFAVLWFLLMPFAIWLEDTLRWGFWHQGKPYGLISIYKDFFTCR